MNIFLHYKIALLMSLLAGLATVIGGAITFVIKKNNLKGLSLGLGFSAGVMIFLSLTSLLKEAESSLMQYYPNNFQWIVFIGFFIGVLLAVLIDYFLPDHIENDLFLPKPHHHNKEEAENYIEESETEKIENMKHKHRIKRAGILTAIAVCVHNFPEGMATFFVSSQNLILGLPIVFAIALHNIPEGISVALPIYHATGKKRLAILYSFLSGISEPVGALIGLSIINLFLPELLIGLMFALVAGIMIYISFDTLLPLAKEYGDWHLSIIGIISGIIIIWVSLLIIN